MKTAFARILGPLCAAALPLALYSFSGGPVVERTGAAVDGGLDCTECHRSFGSANSDPSGRILLRTSAYKPGVRQTIQIIVEHPEARRWGFQLTARLASNEARKAGTLLPNATVQVRCGGNAPPGNCGANTEFAEHTFASTQTGTLRRGVWELEWIPPDTDAGEVVFYAAGNAANGNNNQNGDFIYTTRVAVPAEVCNSTETPRVTTVRHGASFLEGPFALNTLISIGGAGFQVPGGTRLALTSDIVDRKFPTSLGCLAVEIGNRRAPLSYASATQINAQIPSLTDLGPVPLRVIANPDTPNERRSDAVMIRLTEFSPAFFRFLPSTAIVATAAGTSQLIGEVGQIAGARGARPGEMISLFATGLAVADPFFQAGEIVSVQARLTERTQVEWNGVPIQAEDLTYMGLSPGSISGLYQINLRVPANASGGNNQVRIRQGSVLSPEGTTIFVSP